MKLTNEQLDIMNAPGHLLVVGGPGSGKTTVSILKAAKIAKEELRPGQNVLFLSFARATISRVIEAIEQEKNISREHKQRIEVDTYHAFFWRILKTHGYLLGLPKAIDILTPSNEAIALSSIRNKFSSINKSKLTEEEKTNLMQEKASAIEAELERLAAIEGRICFNLFAAYVAAILHSSDKIRKVIATMYPVIILDEFQDTSAAQWSVVKELSHNSKLLALADPEQRIYDWIGADPERLNHFKATCQPDEFDLQGTNHRSAGTDIALFGNHVLTGNFKTESYLGVECEIYKAAENPAMTALILAIYAARERLINAGEKNWSVAILVATKKMTRMISDALQEPPGKLKKISHFASVEIEAAILGAELIAFLMEPGEG